MCIKERLSSRKILVNACHRIVALAPHHQFILQSISHWSFRISTLSPRRNIKTVFIAVLRYNLDQHHSRELSQLSPRQSPLYTMSSLYILPANLGPSLIGRDAVADALHRCATAFDTDDVELFNSSFMPDGVFEVNGNAMKGLPTIRTAGLAIIFGLDTTHLVTNVRVSIPAEFTRAGVTDEEEEEEDSKASITATVLSQHYSKGKGLERDQKSLMAGSLYRGDLIRDKDGLWKFSHLKIKSIWMEGDNSVVSGSSQGMKETV